jgi:hypothetical protein
VDLSVDEWQLNKKYRRMCKGKTLIRRKGYSNYQYTTFGCPFTPENKAAILAQNPDVIEFINERFV